ncbi:hypothetical protein [Rhodococcus sp. NPDC127528]|uniref:VG15 protein n=1 Tax=unclassified Rhodococcus (in: high G+C Gram-positive bacteria) TaxID=192944 RepID=UPI003627A254
MLPSAATSYYDSQRESTLEFLALAGELWGPHPPRDFDSWFGRNVDDLVAAAMVGQQQVIADSDSYVAAVLEETGVSVAAEVAARPRALVGVASDGRPLDSLLYGSVIHAKGKIADGAPASVAWDLGLQALTVRMHTLLADTARAATGLSIAARPRVGYVRMLVGRSCSRCAILAGRFYPYSAGFLRHPQCNCRHIPANEDTADDVRTDPRRFFDSLSEAEQDKAFTIAGAQAIRDGADMSQVVNARRGAHGLEVAGSSLLHRGLVRRDVYGQQLHTTTEGVTKRGIAGRAIRARGRDAATTPRLMPEAIYEIAESRNEALRLLRMNGYVVDGPRHAAPDVTHRPQSGTTVTKPEVEHPKASSDGNGPTGPIGPKKPGTGGGGDDGGEGDGWHGHTRGYQHPHSQPIWSEAERVARQRELGINLNGEQLYQHEVEAVERLQALGHEFEWIPRSWLPTNDAIWKTNGGIEFDLKSTGSKYDAISTHLRRSVIKARAQDVVKENFIIDLGPRWLTDKLRGQLSRYNARNPDNRIVGLWVIAKGELTRIDQVE